MAPLPDKEFRTAYHDHIRRDVLPYVPKTGGQLLDLGGGIGATAAEIRSRNLVDRVGVADLVDNSGSPLALDYCYQANLEEPGLVSKIVAEQGKMQMVLALDILEHLLDPWAMARQLSDALDDGGYMVASIPNIRNYRALLPLVTRNRWDYKDAGILDRTHLRFFTKPSAIDLIAQTGLNIKQVAPSQSGGGKIKLFRTLTLGMLNSFTDRQYIIVAQKV
ncbi:methyltransferase domain-containing protein [Parasphingorhabdus sp. DH2-15]|uniref:methyltransferase domain-containing protein n=1 Tax=Parasphingorhabdus sp. DH2-15 TaxID=3444112 RepID=UPI003F682A9F